MYPNLACPGQQLQRTGTKKDSLLGRILLAGLDVGSRRTFEDVNPMKCKYLVPQNFAGT